MIFDYQKYALIKDNYSQISFYASPPIIQRYDLELYNGEKEFLEEIITQVPQSRRKQIISSLLAENWANHIGAWFELHLFHWLQENCMFTPVFTDGRNKPDFKLKSHPEIFIEARSFLVNSKDRVQGHLECELSHQLHKLKIPAEIFVSAYHLHSFEKIPQIVNQIESILISNRDGKYTINIDDEIVVFEILEYSGDNGNLGVSGFGKFHEQMAESLKQGILDKYKKYQNFQNSKEPYILAAFLEDPACTHEDYRFAIYGYDSYTIDIDTKKTLNIQTDFSGVHYQKGQFTHRTISGDLVFVQRYNQKEKRRTILGYFIENPYALDRDKFSPDIFKTVANFKVMNWEGSSPHMKWVIKHE